jgi:hypothetical protein
MNAPAASVSSEAQVATAVPARYLAQLCKHVAHKLPVTFDERHGRIEFAAGPCELDAAGQAGVLLLRVSAGDEAGLAQLEGVVARHLERFAFREKPEIRWRRAG